MYCMYCRLCQRDTLTSDPLSYFQIFNYGQLFLKRSTNIEALRLKTVFFYDFGSQKDAHDKKLLPLEWLKDQTGFLFIELLIEVPGLSSKDIRGGVLDLFCLQGGNWASLYLSSLNTVLRCGRYECY